MTQKMKHLWGLPTIEPDTSAVGACLAVGRKPTDRIGWPIEKDVFHIVETKTRERRIKTGKRDRAGKPIEVLVEYREHDPRFKAFNEAPKPTRQVFYAMLCYHREEEVWNPNYGMYRAPKNSGLVNPRSKRFSCVGNGRQADRWMGDHSEIIECPGEGCLFRQGDEPPCRPRARFLFLPMWKVSQGQAFARYAPVMDESGERRFEVEQLLERPIMRLATQGRAARDTFAGMLKTVRSQAEGIGCKIHSWWGLPFEIRLSESRNPEKKTRWPDITFTLAGDWMAWLRFQAGEFRALAEAPEVALLGSASDAELDAEAVGAEHAAIVPVTSKPAPVTEPSHEDVIDADFTEEHLDEVRPSPSRTSAPPAAAGPFSAPCSQCGATRGEDCKNGCSGESRMTGTPAEPEVADDASGDGDREARGAESAAAPAPISNYDLVKAWADANGFGSRKGMVSAQLREDGLISEDEIWSDIRDGAPRPMVEASLGRLLEPIE